MLLLCRDVAQQVERLSYAQQAEGSIPSVPIGGNAIAYAQRSADSLEATSAVKAVKWRVQAQNFGEGEYDKQRSKSILQFGSVET